MATNLPDNSHSEESTPPTREPSQQEESPRHQRNISNLTDINEEYPVHARPQGSAASMTPIITRHSSIPALTGATPRFLPNDSNRTLFTSPDIGNFESSIPPRGPLNHNITMGPQRHTSTSSEASFMSTRSLPSGDLNAIPEISSLHASQLPDTNQLMQRRASTQDNLHPPLASQMTYKPRTRKVHTKEVTPEDMQSVIELGMSPFMIGQDSMANQNRLVKNEAILTRHVSRLHREHRQSDSKHSKTEEDIYRILQEHSASINSISAPGGNTGPGGNAGVAHAPSSLRNDPDFVALFEAQEDMRRRLDQLIADVTASRLSSTLMLENLEERFRQLAALLPAQIPPTPTSTPLLGHDTLLGSRILYTSFEGVPLSRPARKRKRDDWPTSTTPTRTDAMRERRPSPRHYHRGPWIDAIRGDDSAPVDVVYGPIASLNRTSSGGGGSSSNYVDADDDDEDDDADKDAWSQAKIKAIAYEALRDVGMLPRLVQSVRRAHDNPNFIVIRFLQYEYATTFIELVRGGSDGHSECSARFLEAPEPTWRGQGGIEERVASTSRARPNATMSSASNIERW